jgi:hypothetical protein
MLDIEGTATEERDGLVDREPLGPPTFLDLEADVLRG